MSNPLKTHTDNLQDGDFIFSPSLTNMLEGVHGNGILLLEDYATGESRRVTPSSLPGAIAYASANTVTIKGGHAVLDGMLVDFAGGYNSNTPNTLTLDLDNSNYGSALGSGEQCLFVIYVTTDNSTGVNRIGVERSSGLTSFPNTPTDFLNEGGSLDVDQTFVLGVVKAVYAANSTTMKIDIQSNSNIYDLRSYVRPSPLYLGRVSTGTVGATATDANRVNFHTDLDGIHGGGTENGSFTTSDLGALWMGADESNNDVLFFSGSQGSSRRTHRLGPNLVLVQGSSANISFQFDDYNYFILTPTGNITLTADTSDAVFPPGHTIFVSNKHASNTITFGSFTINGNTSAVFVFDGSNWQQTMLSSSATTTSSGASGLIQLSDGSSGFTSDTTFSFNASSNKLTVTGDASVTNVLSDPKAVEFTPHSSNLGSTAGNTLWMDTGDSNKLKLGSDTILTSGNTSSASYNFIGLTDTPANFNSASNKFLQVNNGNGTNGTAVEFGTIVEGDLPTTLPSVTSIGSNGSTLTAAGNLSISGTLTVSGGTTTISSTTITVDDKHIELGAVDTPSDTTADGGGVILKAAADRSILWSNANDAWEFNQHIFPSTDSTYNLGSNTIRFANGYFDTLYGAGSFSTITGSGNLAIDTDTLKVDVTNDRVGINQGTPLAPLQIANVGFGEATGTQASGSNNGVTTIDVTLFSITEFRSGKLLIEFDGEDGSSNRVIETVEAVVTHDGSNSSITVYGDVQSNSSETKQGAYTTDINSGNLILKVTPQVTGIDCDVRVSWQAMVI
jgi:hypothetical protein|tara:strand:- start:2699 stop:5062 length:2364 start_codon:yes stop_codon:yes gene_type:complete